VTSDDSGIRDARPSHGCVRMRTHHSAYGAQTLCAIGLIMRLGSGWAGRRGTEEHHEHNDNRPPARRSCERPGSAACRSSRLRRPRSYGDFRRTRRHRPARIGVRAPEADSERRARQPRLRRPRYQPLAYLPVHAQLPRHAGHAPRVSFPDQPMQQPSRACQRSGISALIVVATARSRISMRKHTLGDWQGRHLEEPIWSEE
jgi:hypothetical protein